MKRCLLFIIGLAAFSVSLASSTSFNEFALTGRVVDAATRKPVNTPVVVTDASGRSVSIPTNEKGEFKTTLLPSTEYKITVTVETYDTLEKLLIPNESKSGFLELLLTPRVKLVINGTVQDEKTGTPVQAILKVFLNSDFIKTDSLACIQGTFSEPLTQFGWYMIELAAPGYQPVFDTIWVMSCQRKTLNRNYLLPRIEKGLTIQLSSVNFHFNKSTIDEASFAALDRMAEFLAENPTMKVEVGGHTDNEGADEYNRMLSQARAQSVVNYLIGKGVSKSQLSARGYGKDKPLHSNDTEAGRAMNRRVELIVVSN
jgi:outer membrane protein OmpA-like peptidoglycan-associated protein